MSRAVAGAALGALAAALAVLGHLAGGGASAAVMTAVLVAASALVFAAAAELRAPIWALALLGVIVQVAGHLLLAPLGGHAHVGGHAHGMPGQVRSGSLDAVVTHLASGGAAMVTMHVVSFAALLAVLALAAPLMGLLVRLERILSPCACLVAPRPWITFASTPRGISSPLQYIVVRRGPPAFV
jgi:hypothetical protein